MIKVMVEDFVKSLSKEQRHNLWMFLASIELLYILDLELTESIYGKDNDINL